MAGKAGRSRRWRRLMTDSDQTMALAVGRAMDKSAAPLDAAAVAGDTEARCALGDGHNSDAD